MSDLSKTVHNLESLFAGKSTFDQFAADEYALFKKNVASLPPAAQPAAQVALDTFASGASAAVGVGQTAIGAFVNMGTDQIVTVVMNLLNGLGVPTTGAALTAAEQAAATALINGLKAGIEKAHLTVLLGAPVVAPPAQPVPSSAPFVQPPASPIV